MTGILFADYFLVRNRALHLSDLYVGNSASAYWYTAGFNWRPIIAWYVSPSLTPSPTAPPLLVLSMKIHSWQKISCN